ncbi:hypothetical protein M404DRAFT_309781 [Pisolithus tinctorius Marx 270]|uniref:Uncharacterized protein n=1 Tax=Pisolithus tinctorius Marx 270 TaxID=870435 RepID=A0A0C3JJK8_PISTI|nr:hypothetical protein M404DRAFT_309781 [Pisolithus tinctorius Marx 270]
MCRFCGSDSCVSHGFGLIRDVGSMLVFGVTSDHRLLSLGSWVQMYCRHHNEVGRTWFQFLVS